MAKLSDFLYPNAAKSAERASIKILTQDTLMQSLTCDEDCPNIDICDVKYSKCYAGAILMHRCEPYQINQIRQSHK